MKTASEALVSRTNVVLKEHPRGANDSVHTRLRTVGNAFIQAQQRRNDADYNVAKEMDAR